MMLALTLAAVAALGPRPAGLTGGDPAAYAAWLHARTLTADRAFGAPPCPTATVRSLGGRVLPRAEQAEGEAAARTAGQPVWLEQVRLEGCGRATVHTLQTIRRGPGRWSATATFPGALRSTPRAQTEAVQRLAGVILNGRPALPCSSTEALRTLAHTPGALTASAGARWTERWPMTACGVDRTVEVTFDGGRATSIAPVWDGR
jgi:hypothetical protein